MPKVTIKSLQEQIAYLTENLNKGKDHESWQSREIERLRAEVVQLRANLNVQERTIQWHKQLSQNLSEGICAYMRSR